MGKNYLLDALRTKNAKSKKFDNNASIISYKTGFPVLDYYLGYRVNVFNDNNELVETYPCIGIPAGSYIEFIGKPSTSKTTTAVQIAANIVRRFENGSIIHFDLEQAMNMSRIQALTKFSIQDIEQKYVLRQEQTTLEDMKEMIIEICEEKNAHPDVYKYESDKINEFGEKIILYEPTVVILDSIATISNGLNIESKKDLEKMKEISSQTERMRLTGEIGRFFTEILPHLRTYNVILIAINQIKVNPNMGIVKSPAEILYLSQDEASRFPGGASKTSLIAGISLCLMYQRVIIIRIGQSAAKYLLEDMGSTTIERIA